MRNKLIKDKKVYYLVSSSLEGNEITDTFEAIRDTLEEAYRDEIQNETEGKLYAFKIELLGEVKQTLEIVK